jgi:hypothetical protein
VTRLATGAGTLVSAGAPAVAGPRQGEGQGEEPAPLASDYATLAGLIQPPGRPGERLTVEPIFHEPFRRAVVDDLPGSGRWSISLEDASGRTLYARYMDVSFPTLPSGRQGARAFLQSLPWHAFTRRIVIREGATVWWERAVPAAWPAVALLAPRGGEHWEQGQRVTVRWAAEDPEGLDLYFQVDLSADDGLTWRPVGSTLRHSELELATSFLPGCSACRLRVRASNAVLMSEAVSEPFRIDAPAPVAEIVAPPDGGVWTASDPLWLEGVAYDAGDGPLGAGQVTWASSLDGQLGRDPTLQALLSVGTHTLRFTALNSAGRSTTDEITLRVLAGRRDYTLWVPWVEMSPP